MANRRMIASDVFEDEFTGQLPGKEFKLWIGIIVAVADDQGRMIDNPALLRAKVFLYDNIDYDEIESALKKFHKAGRIVRYSAGGKSLIQLVNWWKYQGLNWASPSSYLPPDGWTDKEKHNVRLPGSDKPTVVKRNWLMAGGFSTDGKPDNQLPNQLPNQLYSGIDIDIDIDTESELDIGKSGGAGDFPEFINMQNLLTTIVGLPASPNDISGIEELVKLGVTEEDIRDALGWRKDNGKKPVRTLSQLFAGCITSRDIRVQNGNASKSKKPEPSMPYIGS